MLAFCIIGVILGLCMAADSLSTAERKWNVIAFLVDDMGFIDCGAYCSQYYETPSIDRSAPHDMRFINDNAQPGRSPTRCSLLTGKAPGRQRMTGVSRHSPPQPPGQMDPTEYTLAVSPRDAGYPRPLAANGTSVLREHTSPDGEHVERIYA
jgi:arylsulfatase A-like enzyme